MSLKLEDILKNYPRKSLVSTIVCAGNRRSDMIKYDIKKAELEEHSPYVKGLSWSEGAISTAEWTGVLLVDLLAYHLLPSNQRTNYQALYELLKNAGVRHIRFDGKLCMNTYLLNIPEVNYTQNTRRFRLSSTSRY